MVTLFLTLAIVATGVHAATPVVAASPGGFSLANEWTNASSYSSGETGSFTVDVTSRTGFNDAIVQLEIREKGNWTDAGRILNQWFTHQDFMPNETRRFAVTFAMPPHGAETEYRLIAQVYDANWSNLAKYFPDTAVTMVSDVVAPPALPAPVPEPGLCVDLDGDGWGWLGEWPAGRSCEVAPAPPVPPVPPAPVPEPDPGLCVDPDGDGWGWLGEWPAGRSCEVAATTPDHGYQACGTSQTARLRDDFTGSSLNFVAEPEDRCVDGWIGRIPAWEEDGQGNVLHRDNWDRLFKMWDDLSYRNGPTAAEDLRARGIYGSGPFLHTMNDGTLTLAAYPASPTLATSIWDNPYVGSMISTERWRAVEEGSYVEIRYRNKALDRGTHVAAWLASHPGQPWAEVDIMETLNGSMDKGEFKPQAFFAFNAHDERANPDGVPQTFINVDESDFAAWHTFRLEWTADELIWLMDGEEVRRQRHALGDTTMWFMVTMEGSSKWTGPYGESTRWPQEAEIDYVDIGPLDA